MQWEVIIVGGLPGDTNAVARHDDGFRRPSGGRVVSLQR